MTHGPRVVQVALVPQQPTQQLVDVVHAPPSGVHSAPPSRDVGWQVLGAMPVFTQESPSQQPMPRRQVEPCGRHKPPSTTGRRHWAEPFPLELQTSPVQHSRVKG